jgi:hypothetical protein
MTVRQDAVPGSRIDSLLFAYDSSGTRLAADDNGGAGLNSLVEFDVVAGQTYYLKAAADGAVGRYRLTLLTVPPPAGKDLLNPQETPANPGAPVTDGADQPAPLANVVDGGFGGLGLIKQDEIEFASPTNSRQDVERGYGQRIPLNALGGDSLSQASLGGADSGLHSLGLFEALAGEPTYVPESATPVVGQSGENYALVLGVPLAPADMNEPGQQVADLLPLNKSPVTAVATLLTVPARDQAGGEADALHWEEYGFLNFVIGLGAVLMPTVSASAGAQASGTLTPVGMRLAIDALFGHGLFEAGTERVQVGDAAAQASADPCEAACAVQLTALATPEGWHEADAGHEPIPSEAAGVESGKLGVGSLAAGLVAFGICQELTARRERKQSTSAGARDQ